MVKCKFFLIILVSLLITVSLSFAQAANEGSDKPAAETELPKIGFIPFNFTTAVNPGLAQSIMLALAKKMLTEKLFQPVSIDKWLDQVYKEEKANNADAIVQRIREVNYDLEFVCHGMISKIDTKYMIKVTLYPFVSFIGTSHYIRYYNQLAYKENSIEAATDSLVSEIVAEIKKRVWQENTYYFDKKIYIENFKLHLFYTTSLEDTNETVIVPVEFLKLNNTDFKTTDNFFNEMLLYSFHRTGLFEVKNSNLPKYIKERPDVPKDTDFRIATDFVLSDNLNVLLIDVWDQKTNKKITSYNYPFSIMDLMNMESIMRKNSFLISLAILSEKEKEQVGFAEIVTKSTSSPEPIFCNEYYLGNTSQEDLLLPLGENNIRIGKKLYKMFVFPFTKNKQYWDYEDSVMTQILNLIKDE